MLKYLVLLSILFGIGCGKDPCQDPSNPSCSNYDPCYGKQETSADFYTEVKRGNRWFDVEVGESELELWRFRAKDSTADEYLWEVGTDKFTTKSFVLRGFPLHESIPIKLTVKRYKPYTGCYPNDKGTATRVKYIYTSLRKDFEFDYQNNTTPTNTTTKTLWGKYRGYNKRAPNFIFDFEFRFVNEYWNNQATTYYGSYQEVYYPAFEMINLPYNNVGLYNSYFSTDTIMPMNTIYGFPMYTVDGVPNSDGTEFGIQAGHFSLNAPEYDLKGNYWPHKVSKYFSFFKSYMYFDDKDHNHLIVEYWYRDTLTHHIVKDTFIGTRIP